MSIEGCAHGPTFITGGPEQCPQCQAEHEKARACLRQTEEELKQCAPAVYARLLDRQAPIIGLHREDVSERQLESIRKLIALLRGAHYADIVVRYEGEDRHFEGDWLKHLKFFSEEKPEPNALELGAEIRRLGLQGS